MYGGFFTCQRVMLLPFRIGIERRDLDMYVCTEIFVCIVLSEE